MFGKNGRPAVRSRLPIVYLIVGVVATGVYFLLLEVAQVTLHGPVNLSSMVAISIGVRRYRPRQEGDRV